MDALLGERERLTWSDPDGLVWDLTGDINDPGGAFVTSWGITGLGAPERQLVTKPLPSGGVQVTHLTVDAGKIAIPLHIVHPTRAGFYQLRERLRRALHPRRADQPAPGMLTYTRADGTARQIEAFCTAMPEDRDTDKSGPAWQATVLEFLAPDPYWADVTPLRLSFTPPPVTSFFGSYWTLSDERVRGDVEIFNTGQVDAYPVWTLTGPAAAVRVANFTTDQEFTYRRPIESGEQVRIDTARGRQAVRRVSDGANRMNALDWPGASLWPLTAEINRVRLQMVDAGPSASTVVEFRRRYEGP